MILILLIISNYKCLFLHQNIVYQQGEIEYLERKEVAIALAIALEPLLVIADEPTSSLDVSVANQVMNELSLLCKELGSALLFISHDLSLASKWCERIAILDEGKIVEEGKSHDVLTIRNIKISFQFY